MEHIKEVFFQLRAFVVEVIHITIPVWDNAENTREIISVKPDLLFNVGRGLFVNREFSYALVGPPEVINNTW